MSSDTPAVHPESLNWFGRDLESVTINRHLLASRYHVNVLSEDHARCLEITGDLWRRQYDHSRAVFILLSSHLFPSAQVVSRVSYETAVNVIYLLTVGNKLVNTRLFEARMLMEIVEEFPWASENAKTLEALPEAIKRQAGKRMKDRLPWSGIKLERMARMIGVEGHEGIYAGHSWSVHSRIAGLAVEHVDQPDGSTRLQFVDEADPEDVLLLANHARMMLRRTYETVMRDLYRRTLPLPTPDPARLFRLTAAMTRATNPAPPPDTSPASPSAT